MSHKHGKNLDSDTENFAWSDSDGDHKVLLTKYLVRGPDSDDSDDNDIVVRPHVGKDKNDDGEQSSDTWDCNSHSCWKMVKHPTLFCWLKAKWLKAEKLKAKKLQAEAISVEKLWVQGQRIVPHFEGCLSVQVLLLLEENSLPTTKTSCLPLCVEGIILKKGTIPCPPPNVIDTSGKLLPQYTPCMLGTYLSNGVILDINAPQTTGLVAFTNQQFDFTHKHCGTINTQGKEYWYPSACANKRAVIGGTGTFAAVGGVQEQRLMYCQEELTKSERREHEMQSRVSGNEHEAQPQAQSKESGNSNHEHKGRDMQSKTSRPETYTSLVIFEVKFHLF